jgi:CDP-diglyceride synthetase
MMNLDYYIRNTVGSFLGIVILATVIRFTLWEYTPEQYELASTIFGTLLFFLGLVGVGYFNAKQAPGSKFKQSSIVHLILVLFTFVTDLFFGNSDAYIVILRNVCYLVALQIGGYFFIKRQFRNLHFLK